VPAEQLAHPAGLAEQRLFDPLLFEGGRAREIDKSGPLLGQRRLVGLFELELGEQWVHAIAAGDAFHEALLAGLNAGGIFNATGRRFLVSIQHNVTGHGVILEITGWR